MSSYTITIAPDDQTRATTTLRVEVTDNVTRITELLVRAGEGEGLTPGQLPAVDLDQLLRAVVPATTAPAVAATTSTPETLAPVAAPSGTHTTDSTVGAPQADVPPASSADVSDATPEPAPAPAPEERSTTVDSGAADDAVGPQPEVTAEVAATAPTGEAQPTSAAEIGRASCRERVCHNV